MRSLSKGLRKCLPRRWWIGPLRAVAGLAGLLALGCAALAIDSEMGEAAAIRELQKGGAVVYLRHAARVGGARDNLSANSTAAEFADCSTQRDLTPEGRAQARALGEYWRKLAIPVARVIAGAQCRTRDTAILAFGAAQLEPWLFDLDFVRNLLLQSAPEHENIVIVASDSQLRDLTGIELNYAEAAVVKPDGKGGITILARLDLDDWANAAEPSWW